MTGSTKQPTVFISYSWTSPKHESWVLELSERLMVDGILVTLDKWDLKEGQDKYAFMEKMVNDKKINKVLVICDKKYTDKADNRDGGVGTETQIISPKVYGNVKQEKFIPIVTEKNDEGEAYLPSFMSGRIYIDLSSDDIYENGYQRLVKILYEIPVLEKPPIGIPPPYITEKNSVASKTIHKKEQIKVAILGEKKNKHALISSYFSEYLNSLKEFKIKRNEDEEFDDTVLKNIEALKPLRDDFIEFSQNIFQYDDEIKLDEFHDFFEKLISFQFKPEDVQQWNRLDYDNYKFFSYELFLYFITVLLNLKRYKEAAYFINEEYFFKEDNIGELIHIGPSIFNRHISSLNEVRNSRLKLNRVSITADTIKQRADRKDISFNNIIQTDLVLHYLTALNIPDNRRGWWFPRCSAFNFHGSTVELFERLISKKYFDQIKTLFKVNSKEEFLKKIETYTQNILEKGDGIDDFYYHVPSLTDIIKLKELATI